MTLSEEENRTLTQVGPGTPMGDLLRRYWHPIEAAAELEETPVKPVRLLGEDLVVYKDERGGYGLIGRWCAHRLTDLSLGIVEEDCLRCPRHGWLYDGAGRCIDQPMEPEPFTEDVRISGYAVQEKAGLLWAYLGPSPAPLLPDWEPFSRDDAVFQIVFAPLPCNWLQCQENSLDIAPPPPFRQASGGPWSPPPLPEISVDELAYGFVCREGSEDGAWRTDQVSLWPNGQYSGDERSCRFEWRVPMNDTSTLSVSLFIDRPAAGAALPAEKRIFHWRAQLQNDANGDWLTTHPLNRKFAIWVHQGAIVDRTREHLAEADRGLVLLRNRYFSQIELIHDGGEPKWVLRSAADNRRLPLPSCESTATSEAPGSQDAPSPDAGASFLHVAGQPPEAAAAYEQVVATWRPDGK